MEFDSAADISGIGSRLLTSICPKIRPKSSSDGLEGITLRQRIDHLAANDRASARLVICAVDVFYDGTVSGTPIGGCKEPCWTTDGRDVYG